MRRGDGPHTDAPALRRSQHRGEAMSKLVLVDGVGLRRSLLIRHWASGFHGETPPLT
jgi:hypothetical protein